MIGDLVMIKIPIIAKKKNKPSNTRFFVNKILSENKNEYYTLNYKNMEFWNF